MIILDDPSHGTNAMGKTVEQVLNEGYSFKFGQYISRAIEIFKTAPSIFILATLIYFAGSVFASIIPAGSLLFSLCAGPQMAAGYLIIAHLIVRKREYGFSNFFDAFSRQFSPFLLLGLATMLLTIVVVVPLVIALAGYFISYMGNDGFESAGFPFSILKNVSQGVGIFALILIIPAIYLAISWVMAPGFVLFRGMDAMKAMESSRKVVRKKWGHFFLFMLFTSFAGILLGALFCGVGLLITFPIIYLCHFAAFEDIMGFSEDNEQNAAV